MTIIGKKVEDQFPQFKKNVESWRTYFHDNIKRAETFKNFVCDTSLTETQKAALRDLGKPLIEFNVLEAVLSRLKGEFSRGQPSLQIRLADGINPSMINKDVVEQMDILESYFRSIFFDGTNDMLEYKIYTDTLLGGFSVMRVNTDYVNAMSFEQSIYVDIPFDVSMCVFDPLAQLSHKGDGKYAGELFIKTREEVEDMADKNVLDKIRYRRNGGDFEGFTWSYKGEDNREMAMLCDYYYKTYKSAKIIKLTNGHVVTEKEYEEFLEKWEADGSIEEPPVPTGRSRQTVIERIEKAVLCEGGVIDHEKSNYKMLPLIFVDGNSVKLKKNGAQQQMTRPYVYHAEGIQQLKNCAGQTLASEIENITQSKYIIARESIPDDERYINAYTNPQKASVLTYNHFLDEANPEITCPPPMPVQRSMIPPQVTDAFRMSDEMTQVILGNYDSSAGMNRADMSGIAFARSAMQSNTTAMPYITGFMQALNRSAEIILDLIPKYLRTPRTLPMLSASGERDYVEINKPGRLYMNYDPNTLHVKVEAGVNFAMQKEIALQTIVALMQASSQFADFMNTKGLPMLVDNLDIRGIDELKEKAAEFMQEQAEQKQQAQQAQAQQSQSQQVKDQLMMQEAQKIAQSPTPEQVDMQRNQEKAQYERGKLAIDEADNERKFLETMAKIRSDDMDAALKAEESAVKSANEEARTAVEIMKEMSAMGGDDMMGGDMMMGDDALADDVPVV